MKTVHVNRFGEGMASDIYNSRIGKFSHSIQFDFLSYPNRLYPLRSMTNSTANTGIGNIQVFSNGSLYALGTDINNPTFGAIYKRDDYGASGSFTVMSNSLTGEVANYNLLVEYTAQTKSIIYAGTTAIYSIDTGNVSAGSQALTFTWIGQGFVHPKDNILYIPYRTSATTGIKFAINNAGSWSFPTSLILPVQYTNAILTSYGDYLSIACSSNASGSGLTTSVVLMWNRDTSLTTVSETIPWGSGRLQAFNNLNGVLLGVSNVGTVTSSYTNQDYDSLVVKEYSGGVPEIIEEIPVKKQTTTFPSITINPRVNFIYRNRMYFSADIVGGSTSPVYKGLWCIGKSKSSGQYVVGIERFVTSDGSDGSVLSCAIAGDYVAAVHTAVGTVTFTINGTTSTASYINASIHESVVNPEMPDTDKPLNKKLMAFAIHLIPLLSGQQIVIRCRVDSTTAWSSCPIIFTKTDTSPDSNLVVYESQIISSMNILDGRNFEFRIESTIGAIPVGYSYKYKILPTNI